MQKRWIVSFTEEMERLGRHKQFFVEPCREYADCVVV
jgi:hypothetical protein